MRYITTVATVEEYDQSDPIIDNGDCIENFDFLYVVKGNIEFHLSEAIKVPSGQMNKFSQS